MKPMFEIERWGNAYATGYQYKFLWGYVVLEFEWARANRKRPWMPFYIEQLGGDHLLLLGVGWFNRSLYLSVWEFDQ